MNVIHCLLTSRHQPLWTKYQHSATTSIDPSQNLSKRPSATWKIIITLVVTLAECRLQRKKRDENWEGPDKKEINGRRKMDGGMNNGRKRKKDEGRKGWDTQENSWLAISFFSENLEQHASYWRCLLCGCQHPFSRLWMNRSYAQGYN